MFSVEDIIAMKVQAVLGRAKKKDFWDIAELRKHFTLDDFVYLHKKKYNIQSPEIRFINPSLTEGEIIKVYSLCSQRIFQAYMGQAFYLF